MWDGQSRPIWGPKMFVEFSSDGRISAAYVEQQYPDQKWVPPSNEALQAFLGDAPKLGKDAKVGPVCSRLPFCLCPSRALRRARKHR